MKKLYTLLAATMLVATSFAQITYDLQVDLTTPASGAEVAPGIINVEFDLTNNGPDAVPAGDTLFFSYIINPQLGASAQLYSFTGTLNQASGLILPVEFPASVTVSSTDLFAAAINLDLSSRPEGTVVAIVCWGANSAALSEDGDLRDIDFDNNLDVFLIGAESIGVESANTLTFTAFPNPATDALNINSNEEIATINVLSLDGKLVATSTSSSVNVAELTAGVYVYEVTSVNGNKAINKFVKK